MTCLPVAEVDIECDLGRERERESNIQSSGDREPLGSRVSDQNEQIELNLEEGTENSENEEILPHVDCCSPINPVTQIKPSTFIAEQQKSKELAPIIESVKKGNEAYYGIKNGIWVKKKINKLGVEEYLIIVPETLREQIKTICHDGTSGHLGVLKTKNRLLRHFFWPKCYKEIEDFVKTCWKDQR
ncbi:retrovirus-related Pol polyprotein from transposon 17.6 [Trichonephila clavipes]|nr:retrovirus-related Pol polyprotein from transposon 17.6 [Trichonephila clavipes]